MRLTSCLLAAALLAALPLPAADAQSRSDYRGWVDTTFAFDTDGVVELKQVPGDIVVSSWREPRIRIRAYAERVPLRTEFSRRRAFVALDLPESANRNWGGRIGETRYEVTVPEGVRVIAGTVSGDVSVRGTRGAVKVSSVSGDASATETRGEVEVSSVSGDALLRQAAGRVSATSVSGDVRVTDVAGNVKATTVSGDLLLDDVRADDVEVKSVSGEIRFTGPIARTGRYELTTHSGTVELRVPASTRAAVTMSTFSGEIDSDFPVTLQPGASVGRRNRSLEFRIGDGDGGRIMAKTFSGDVVVRRTP